MAEQGRLRYQERLAEALALLEMRGLGDDTAAVKSGGLHRKS